MKNQNINVFKNAFMVIMFFFMTSTILGASSPQVKDVDRLILELKDKDSQIRISAADTLGKIKDARAVEPLIAALKDKDTDVRISAAWALGEIKDARAVEPLIAALKDENSYIRIFAMDALGKIKDTRAVEPLIAALKDEDSMVRWNSAWALGEIKDARAVEPLIAALKDENSYTRSSNNLWAAYFPVREEAAESLGKIKDARAVKVLIDALMDKDLEVIAGAYRYFLRRGQSGTEAILIDALNMKRNDIMAKDFLSCGNSQLEEAARYYAKRNVVQLSEGNDGPKWGKE